MAQSANSNFRCAACGRLYEWTPAIAGKAAKCSCGEALYVPEAAGVIGKDAGPYEIAPPPVVVGDYEDAVSDSPPNVIDYYDHSEERAAQRFHDRLIDPFRDLYLPIGMLSLGFAAALAWVLIERHWGTKGLIVMSLSVGVTALIKTLVVLGLAMFFVSKLDLSFGLASRAILKFAAIVVFVDAARLWLYAAMRALGAISASGRGPKGVGAVDLLFTIALILCALYYLFDMDSDEGGTFARWAAAALILTDIAIKLALMALLRGTPAKATTTPSAALATANSSSSVVAPSFSNAEDREIARRISQRQASEGSGALSAVMEGRACKRSLIVNKSVAAFIDEMYDAGAVAVYIDILGGLTMQQTSKGMGSMKVYVQLPAQKEQRAACIRVAQGYQQAHGMVPNAASLPATRQFLVIDVQNGK